MGSVEVGNAITLEAIPALSFTPSLGAIIFEVYELANTMTSTSFIFFEINSVVASLSPL